MLSVVLKKGQSFWIGAVHVDVRRLGTENVDLWCHGPREIPIHRTEILARMSIEDLDRLGYRRTDGGVIAPCETTLRAA